MYALNITYAKAKDLILKCLEAETNLDKFYDFINMIIREQVDVNVI